MRNPWTRRDDPRACQQDDNSEEDVLTHLTSILLKRKVSAPNLWLDRACLEGNRPVRQLHRKSLPAGLLSEESRGDWTPLELFLDGVRGWETGLRRFFVGLPDGKLP